ncbi:ABC transporter ATP-binding protein [Branchiibius cervicis]|uniref:ABC transporter ATP-binding protein n=1 Tax=Branchiibius cervicis TaxID=908252 RepID=A0ABW2AX99_9MICO
MSATVLPVADGGQIRRYLRTLLPGRRLLLAGTILVMLGVSLLNLAIPATIGWITQAVVDRRHPSALTIPIALLTAAVVAGAICTYFARLLLARLVFPAVGSLREDALSHAVDLPIDVVEAGDSGDVISRVSGDAERVTDAASEVLGYFVTSALAIVAALIGLAAIDWRFAVAGLLAVPIQAHTLRWYLRRSRPIYAAGRAADGRRASALLTGFTALPTLRALGLTGRQRGRIESASKESMGYELAAMQTMTRFWGRLNLAEFVGLAAILLAGFFLVRSGTTSVGAATAAALFFAGLFGPINGVLATFDTLQQAAAGVARLVGVTTVPRHETAFETGTDQVVEVSDLTFGYADGPAVLDDVTLRVGPGEKVAVVGTTGSGKSSLASLVTGLRTPRAGSIVWGRPVVERSAALVTQETHVFAGTIADNLRLGRPDATHEQIAQAMVAVGADHWVRTLPDGLDARVGGGGRPLTAVQAQHLALARVHLMDPALVVLDEANAEAGSDTSRQLDRAFAAVVRGRAAVVIAHRLNQAADADRILVMESGRVVEQGNHAELIVAGGRYAELWHAWSAG